MRLLAAEDDPFFREFLSRILPEAGYSVEVVADGLELLRSALQREPDAVLSDIDMPRCDGVRACSLLRAARPGLRIVMMTVDPSSAKRAHAAGFLVVLNKPFTMGELENALAQGPRSERLQGARPAGRRRPS